MFGLFRTKRKEKTFRKKGMNVIIHGGCRIYGSEQISIGNNVIIGQHALIEGMGGIEIGSNVILGPDVTIWSATHNYENPELLPYDEKVIFKPVVIKDNVWIGAKAILAPGVTVEEGAVIAMGAVVVKNVPKGAVVGGNPARVLKFRNLDTYDELVKEEKFYLNRVKK